MAERFLCSDPLAGDFSFADVESILDALEAALVSSDTPLFDASRQSWQSVGLHPEVRSAWEQRERFRPPGSSRLSAASAAGTERDRGRRPHPSTRGLRPGAYRLTRSGRRRAPRTEAEHHRTRVGPRAHDARRAGVGGCLSGDTGERAGEWVVRGGQQAVASADSR